MSFSPNSCVDVSLSPVFIDRMRPRCFAKIINFLAYAWAMRGNAWKCGENMRGNFISGDVFLEAVGQIFHLLPGWLSGHCAAIFRIQFGFDETAAWEDS